MEIAPNTKNIKFTINSKIIENTKEFKYLGISINSKDCSFKPTLSDLSSKANKAIYSLLSKIPVKLIPVKTMLKLFDSCIAPILLYGSEVWAPFMNFDWKHWDTKSQFIFLMSQENKQLNLKLIPTIHKWLTERLEHNK